MKKNCIKRFASPLAAALLLAMVCAGCQGGGDKGNPEGLLLSLGFDEGSGNQVQDGAGQVQSAQVAYNFTNAVYSDSRDPEWRDGVVDDCLLFDGNSNYISYAPEELLVQGDALTVSVWAAPPGL